MNQHIMQAFLDALKEDIADMVVQRLQQSPPLRPLAKTSGVPLPEPQAKAVGASSEAQATPPEYLTPTEAAALLGLSVKGLEGMRAAGRGPKFLKVGGRIRYRRSDLG